MPTLLHIPVDSRANCTYLPVYRRANSSHLPVDRCANSSVVEKHDDGGVALDRGSDVTGQDGTAARYCRHLR